MRLNVVDFYPEMLSEYMPRQMDQRYEYLFIKMSRMDIDCHDCKAIYDDGRLVAVIGMYKLWEGLWEIIMTFSEDAMSSPYNPLTRRIIAALKEELGRAWRREDVRRMQAYVKDGIEAHRRFAYYMGFQSQVEMRAWGPDGGDYWMVSRIKQ